ncbi:hypothetical protein [Polymorphospora lycopeni]|uniref:ANTAR domain-containing protein n=1 Tax=Polymorphospora lycopeni TaxID=3140240 RepID=A0ABV5CTZ7_9ACTN
MTSPPGSAVENGPRAVVSGTDPVGPSCRRGRHGPPDTAGDLEEWFAVVLRATHGLRTAAVLRRMSAAAALLHTTEQVDEALDRAILEVVRQGVPPLRDVS